jgi:hypothetical protein
MSDTLTESAELLHVDPATLIIGTNIRTDTKTNAKDFANSIRERGVLEVITAYRNDSGDLDVDRGQRRRSSQRRWGPRPERCRSASCSSPTRPTASWIRWSKTSTARECTTRRCWPVSSSPDGICRHGRPGSASDCPGRPIRHPHPLRHARPAGPERLAHLTGRCHGRA